MIAVVLALLRSTGALAAVSQPACANTTIPTGNTTCDIDLGGGEWFSYQVRLVGTNSSSDLAVAIYALAGAAGTTIQYPSALNRNLVSGETALHNGVATCSGGSDVCADASYKNFGLMRGRLQLTNSSGASRTVQTWIYTPDQLTAGGTVSVSNFPATQPVSGTVACSNCAGGGGGGGEVQIDPDANTVQLSGPVALDSEASERLDLAWWGLWALVGLMFALMLAPRWFAAFRVTHGG